MAEKIKELYVELSAKTEELEKRLQQVEKKSEKAESTVDGLKGALEALGGAAVLNAMKNLAMESFAAYRELEKQQVLLKNLSQQDYPALEAEIMDTIKASQGLSSVGELATASNAFLKAGGDAKFLKESMSDLQKVTAATGQDMSQFMGQLQKDILTGSTASLEGSQILSQYIDKFREIGAGSSELQKMQRQQVIMNALAENGSMIQSQYNEYLQSTEGILRVNETAMGDLKENVGALVAQALIPLIKMLTPIIQYFTDAENGMNRVKVALLLLSPVMIAFAGIALALVIVNLWGMAAAGWAAIAPWLPFIAIALGVIAVITLIGLAIDDFLTFLSGGESAIGDFIQWLGFSDETLQAVRDWFNNALDWIQAQVDYLIDLAQKYGKYFIMFLFPLSILYFYWDEIVGVLMSSFSAVTDWVLGLWTSMTDAITNIWNGISGFFEDVASFFGVDSEKNVKVTSEVNGNKSMPEKRATGGPVLSGRSYIVGDGGEPELLTMGSSNGQITPFSDLQGGGGARTFAPVVNVYGPMTAQQAVETKSTLRQMMDELAVEWRAQMGIA